jgi:hypothetical protein
VSGFLTCHNDLSIIDPVIASEQLFDASNMPQKKACFSMKGGVTIKKIRDKNVSFVDDQDNKH